MNKQTEIKRKERFTVNMACPNDYGDLIITDTTGKDHKLSSKRANLFEIFQPGASIEVGIAEYMQKEYIATAVLSPVNGDAIFPVNQPTKVSPNAPQSNSSPSNGQTNGLTRDEQIERLCWIKEVGECVRAGTIKPGDHLATWYFASMNTKLLHGN